MRKRREAAEGRREGRRMKGRGESRREGVWNALLHSTKCLPCRYYTTHADR